MTSSTATDLFKASAVRLYRQQASTVGLIHDEVLLEVPAGEAEMWKARVIEALTDFPDVQAVVPLVAEGGVRSCWAGDPQ